uniref:AAA family ATPase n=1 Tax=Desertifilum tharense IPPAS B-1220 TaxID=1781255 RepID=A0ACD5H430_9CYAN
MPCAGFAPEKATALLSGLPGSGKSLMAVDLAFAVATGGEFLGEKVKQSP